MISTNRPQDWLFILVSPVLFSIAFSVFVTATSQDVQDQDSIRVALFTDPHFTEGRRKNTTPRMPQLASDANHRIPEIDFAMGLGDEVHDHAGWIGIWKRDLVRHLTMPYHFSPGDHDVVDYYWKDQPRSEFPYKVLKGFMRESELTAPSYAMLRSNVLFLVIGDKATILKIHESQKRWVEHMVQEYPNKTTFLVSHAAMRGTTKASNRHDWGWRHSEMWWWRLFKNNPQIKGYIHGDGHALSYLVASNNNQRGYDGTNGDWGHDIAFIEPGGHSLLRDQHNRNQFIVLDVDEAGLRTRTWRNTKKKTGWVDVYNHEWDIPGGTTYDPSVRDWYSFPMFFQDGETQVVRNDVIPFAPVTLQLCGIRPYSLFNNTDIIAGHPHNDKIAGFENRGIKKYLREQGAMLVDGPSKLVFPDKHASKEKGGKSGQIKRFIQHGSVPQIVPGAEYEVSITARSKSKNGEIKLAMSSSSWKSKSQYSTLEGSKQQVLDGEVGNEYTTLSGTYTAPDKKSAWFLQGRIHFNDDVRYSVDAFTIHRKTNSAKTKNFRIKLNENSYGESGVLSSGEFTRTKIAPESLTDQHGRTKLTASIDGNRQGMVRLLFRSPLLFSRNGQFRIDEIRQDTADITLFKPASRFSDRFILFPYINGRTQLSIEPGETEQSESGHKHAEIPIGDGKKSLRVQYEKPSGK